MTSLASVYEQFRGEAEKANCNLDECNKLLGKLKVRLRKTRPPANRSFPPPAPLTSHSSSSSSPIFFPLLLLLLLLLLPSRSSRAD